MFAGLLPVEVRSMTDDRLKGFDPTRTMPRRDRSPAKDPSLKAHLLLLTGDKAGTTYMVRDDRMTVIGRETGCQICLHDPDASRRHAAIQPFGREFYIMDMGSTNGTLINGKLEEKRILRHADKITIGKQEFQFLLTGPDGHPIITPSTD